MAPVPANVGEQQHHVSPGDWNARDAGADRLGITGVAWHTVRRAPIENSDTPGDRIMYETPADIARLQTLLDESHASMGTHMRSIIAPKRRLSAHELVDVLHG